MSLTVKTVQNGENGLNGVGMAIGAAGLQKEKGNGKSVFAGTSMIPSQTDSLVEQKRQNAKKQAKQIIGNAWGKDQKLLQRIEGKWKLWDDKMTQIKKSENVISDVEEAKARLKEQYEIDPESQEQKDLELLEKYQDWRNGVIGLKFSEEELSRLKELQDMPRTEYQTEALKLNNDSGIEKVNIIKLTAEAGSVKDSISADKQKQQISQDMLKAEDTADEIMDAAEKEAVNLLIQEGKDKVDQETEEEKEKAEEIHEKKEEQQEQIEKTREDRKEQEEMIEGDLKTDQIEQELSMKQNASYHVEAAQNMIRRMIKENSLVDEDLKGIEIDFGF